MFRKFFFLIVAIIFAMATASAVSTAKAESVNNKGSTSQIQSIVAENAIQQVMNFDQMQVANSQLVIMVAEQSLSNMNPQNAQSTVITEHVVGLSERFQLMQALCMDAWRANSFFSLSSTAQIENTQQVMMNNSTIVLLSMMNLNFGKERFKKGSIVILKKPIMMSSSLSTQTCSSDVKKIASGGAQLKICSLNLTSANCPIHSTASINKAEVTSIAT